MKTTERTPVMRAIDRSLVGAALLMGMLLVSVQMARAVEIIPSVGWAKSVDGDEDAKVFGGLAIRGSLLPFLKAEVGASYRSEEIVEDNLQFRMWPVTASLWLTPIPVIYAGGGVGWYHTTLDFDSDLPFEDETNSEFGAHIGGGFNIPLGPRAALDLNGRYVFLDPQESDLPPNEFDPDFWSTSVGLAINF